MRNDATQPDPSPEQLAAFVDGELDPAAAAHVGAWVAYDPAAAAVLDGQPPRAPSLAGQPAARAGPGRLDGRAGASRPRAPAKGRARKWPRAPG